MKKLSETLKEMGIAFSFPLRIKDERGKLTYCEDSDGYWCKWERDASRNVTYCENSFGEKEGTPRSAKTHEGKVVVVDGVKYTLKAL